MRIATYHVALLMVFRWAGNAERVWDGVRRSVVTPHHQGATRRYCGRRHYGYRKPCRDWLFVSTWLSNSTCNTQHKHFSKFTDRRSAKTLVQTTVACRRKVDVCAAKRCMPEQWTLLFRSQEFLGSNSVSETVCPHWGSFKLAALFLYITHGIYTTWAKSRYTI